MMRALVAESSFSEAELDELKLEIAKGIPLNRLGVADDIANACLFLSSDLSSYITGAVIDVNGGMLIP